MERRKPIFLCYAAFFMTSQAADYLTGVSSITYSETAIDLAIVLPNLYLAFTRNIWAHGLLMVGLFVILVGAGFATLEQMGGLVR